MKKQTRLSDLIKILEDYDRENEHARVISFENAVRCWDGECYGIWVKREDETKELIKIPYFEEKEIVLTKEEVIKRHRTMWNWIAYETLKRKERVTKREAFEEMNWKLNSIRDNCWCCEYAKNYHNGCLDCPIRWPNNLTCCDKDGLYRRWVETIWRDDYEKAAEYAFQIANLPEREDV